VGPPPAGVLLFFPVLPHPFPSGVVVHSFNSVARRRQPFAVASPKTKAVWSFF
jgi:hypothetical protein